MSLKVEMTNYSTLSLTESGENTALCLNKNNEEEELKLNKPRMFFSLVVFLITFTFYGYCIYHALAPLELFIDQHDVSARRLTENHEIGTTDCTMKNVAINTSVGTIAGAALVCGGFLLLGLTPIGPIAGGIFAANMGAGIASGSLMAMTQAAAMTGTAYATGAAVGAAGGTAYACA